VATGEDTAAVEDCHATLAIATGFATVCGTQEPRALPAKVAEGPVETDGIAVRPGLVAISLAIGEDYPVRFGEMSTRVTVTGLEAHYRWWPARISRS